MIGNSKSAIEVWINGKYIRAIVLKPSLGPSTPSRSGRVQFSICYRSGITDTLAPAHFARTKGTAKLLEVMGGRERWQYDLDLEKTKAAVLLWRKNCLRDGFSMYQPIPVRDQGSKVSV